MQDARNFQPSREMKDDGEEDASQDDAKPFIENNSTVVRQSSASSGSDEERRGPFRGRGVSIGVVAAVGSLVAIAICTAVGMVSSKTSPVKADGDAPLEMPAAMSPRQLFQSDRHVEVVTDNVMALANGALESEDRDMVRDHVAARFQDLSEKLAKEHPEASRAWDVVQLNSVQQAAVLRSMKAMGDPRMQHLGREIGEVLHASMASHDTGAAKRQLADLLTERMGTIRELHDEVCPPEVQLCEEDDGEGLQVHLEKKSVQLTDTLGSNWQMELDMSKPEVSDQAVSLPARRLKSGKGGKGGSSSSGLTLTSGLELFSQFQKYFKKIQQFCKTLGITVPDLSDALKHVDVGALLSCVAQNAVKARATSMFKCGQQFAEAAENVVATLFGGGKKGGKGGKGKR